MSDLHGLGWSRVQLTPSVVFRAHALLLLVTYRSTQGLVSNAEEAANACRGAGDLQTLGRCLSTYWEQKKRMAPGMSRFMRIAQLDRCLVGDSAP